MDLYKEIKKINCVKKVKNFWSICEGKIDFVFFLCPCSNGSGLKLNRLKTGIETKYVDRLSKSGIERIERVSKFIKEFEKLGIPFLVKGIFASADSFTLFSSFVREPNLPIVEGMELITNYDVVIKSLDRFIQHKEKKTWKFAPEKFIKQETERINSILSSKIPDNIKEDFTERVLSGFVLDGELIKEKEFGENPVLLGVESSGVAIIQNSALLKKDWIPVVEIKGIKPSGLALDPLTQQVVGN